MATIYDGLQLPEGEVKAADGTQWKSVMFTDTLDISEMIELEQMYPWALKFKFKDWHGRVYVWKRGAISDLP